MSGNRRSYLSLSLCVLVVLAEGIDNSTSSVSGNSTSSAFDNSISSVSGNSISSSSVVSGDVLGADSQKAKLLRAALSLEEIALYGPALANVRLEFQKDNDTRILVEDPVYASYYNFWETLFVSVREEFVTEELGLDQELPAEEMSRKLDAYKSALGSFGINSTFLTNVTGSDLSLFFEIGKYLAPVIRNIKADQELALRLEAQKQEDVVALEREMKKNVAALQERSDEVDYDEDEGEEEDGREYMKPLEDDPIARKYYEDFMNM